jgi:hypothetical protein
MLTPDALLKLCLAASHYARILQACYGTRMLGQLLLLHRKLISACARLRRYHAHGCRDAAQGSSREITNLQRCLPGRRR